MTLNNDVIVAQATPNGRGALGIIRASGQDVFKIVDNFSNLSRKCKLSEVPANTISHGRIFDQSELVDEVMFLVFHNPRSFTGENSLEITYHNNPLIAQHIITLFCKFGARIAEAGEFSKRAFENDKMDLCQTEAIGEIIAAQTQVALQASLSQLQGTLSFFLENIIKQVLELTAMMEASFEFAEEEQMDLDFNELLNSKLKSIESEISKLEWAHDEQSKIREGVRIAFIGPSNAGKSTLFNALLKKQRALVSDIAGTTRDMLEAQLCKKSGLWTLIDTAGVRDTQDVLEQMGIDKSRNEIEQADIILFVLDSSVPLKTEDLNFFQSIQEKHAGKTLLLLNKQDLEPHNTFDKLATIGENLKISGNCEKGLIYLEKAIESRVEKIFSESNASPFVLTQRQKLLVQQLASEIRGVRGQFNSEVPQEITVLKLKAILETIGSFTGKSLSEEVLGTIFSTFCIGK